MMLRPLLLALGLCLLAPAQADIRHDLADPALTATVNGEPLSNAFVDLMHRIALKGDPGIPRAAVVLALIDDRLIATHARATVTDGHLIEENRVAFSPEMQLRQAMVSNLQAGFREQMEARLQREKGGTLDGTIVAERAPTAAEWTAVLGKDTGLRAEYDLDARGRAAADRVVLLRYRFGKEAGHVTLREVYDAQNVQGRNLLHARNDGFTAAQARLLLKQRWILRWGASPEGLGKADFAVFARAMEDRLVHTGWMAHLGVAVDIHDDPQHIKDLQASVTPEEVRAYYDAHRDEFQRIEKVRARHVRVQDEALAQALFDRLHKGESAEALARQYSTAADAASGGDLGWILHDDKAQGWMASLAFLQKPGVPGRPVRLPGAPGEQPGWEIMIVEERVMGYQDPGSETVRYLASQAVARQKALAEYRGIVERLRREADIRLHPELSPLARPQEAH